VFHRFKQFAVTFSSGLLVFFAISPRAAAQSVTLAWDADLTQTVAGYNVYRSDSPDVLITHPLNGDTPVTDTSFTDTTVETHRYYYYAVTAVSPNGGETSLSNVVQAVTGLPANLAPMVTAGPTQTITLPSTATLSATASDDGLPNGQLTYQWSVVDGDGVTIQAPQSGTTPVSFTQAGTYTLRITASDGQLSASSDVVIYVQNMLRTGFVQIPPRSSGTPTLERALVDFQRTGTLISEAVVRSSPPLQAGRIYAANVQNLVNTGITFADLDQGPVTLDFYFTDDSGATLYSGETTLVANKNLTAFLTDPAFIPNTSLPLDRIRTFTFTASQPIAAAAIRILVNEHSDYLMTGLPIAAIQPSGDTISFPYYADGGGWQSQIQLVNPTDSMLSGIVRFFPSGTIPDLVYTIPSRSALALQTPGLGSQQQTGWVQVIPDSGLSSPSGSLMLLERNNGVTVSIGTIYAASVSSNFDLYIESSDRITPALSIINPAATAVVVSLGLLSTDWKPAGGLVTVIIPPAQQKILSLDQIRGAQLAPFPFTGIVQIIGGGVSPISAPTPLLVTGLERHYRALFNDSVVIPIPATSDSIAASSLETKFVFFVDGGGYTSNFIDIDPSSYTTIH
jgi:hypothetical protein